MRKGERRRHLIAAAKALAADRGFAELSLESLAERVGTTPGQLSRQFPDRDALIRAVLDDLGHDIFPPPEPGDPADAAFRLQAIVERAVRAADKPSPGLRSLIRALDEFTSADAQADLHARMLEWSSPLVALIQEGQRGGMIRRRLDPQVTAWMILQVILGHALIGRRDLHIRKEVGALESLWHGVLKSDV